jgi:hypothetical protein
LLLMEMARSGRSQRARACTARTAISYPFFALFLVVALPRTWASPGNGDFSDGLNGWTTRGDVTTAGGAALLGDNGATHSLLYQPFAVTMSSFTLEFDFQNHLSADYPEGTFPDVFFASVYTTSNPGTFDPDHGAFDSVIGLFALDANGLYNVNPNAIVSTSPLGSTWSHYSLTGPNPSGTVIPYFEVFDLNFVNADSGVSVDNVQVVPEPMTLKLVGTGVLAILFLSWRRRDRARGHG